MGCKSEEKIRSGCLDQAKIARLSALQRTLNAFKQTLSFTSHTSVDVPDYEDTRAVRPHQLEVERQRTLALMYLDRQKYQ